MTDVSLLVPAPLAVTVAGVEEAVDAEPAEEVLLAVTEAPEAAEEATEAWLDVAEAAEEAEEAWLEAADAEEATEARLEADPDEEVTDAELPAEEDATLECELATDDELSTAAEDELDSLPAGMVTRVPPSGADGAEPADTPAAACL